MNKQNLGLLFLVATFCVSSAKAGPEIKRDTKGRTEAECILQLAKDFLSAHGWEKGIVLEDKIYWIAGQIGNKANRYTIYGKGAGELNQAEFKLQLSAVWTFPTCKEGPQNGETNTGGLIDQANTKIASFYRGIDLTQTEYQKYVYPPASAPDSDFLAERSFDPGEIAQTQSKAFLPNVHTGYGLGELGIGALAIAVGKYPDKPGLGPKIMRRAVGPLLIVDGAARIYVANEGKDPGVIPLYGPISKLEPLKATGLRLSRGVLRLPESYEKQLAEPKK